MREILIKHLLGGQDEGEIAPLIPTRLAKFPASMVILGDKAFAYDMIKYPNANKQLTPNFIAKRSHYSNKDHEEDKKICELRYTVEIVFARVKALKILDGVIPYRKFANLHHCLRWAYGRANLYYPLQVPTNFNL